MEVFANIIGGDVTTISIELSRIVWAILQIKDISLMEGIGIALDLKVNRLFITDLGGSIYSAKLDGSDKKILLAVGGIYQGLHIMICP